jgi:DNA-directed RNA polymerase subunit H (RpoH/RPB5)
MTDFGTFYNVYTNTLQLITDRGYTYIEPKKEDIESYNIFCKKINDLPRIIYSSKDNNANILAVYLNESNKKLKPAVLSNIAETILKKYQSGVKNITILFIIISKSVKKTAEKISLIKHTNENIHVKYEFMHFDKMKLCITKHVLSPTFELLTNEEAEKIKMKLNVANMPMISFIDPIVKWFGASRGDVFKITEPHPIALQNISYKLIV